jgi:hypothetical protein
MKTSQQEFSLNNDQFLTFAIYVTARLLVISRIGVGWATRAHYCTHDDFALGPQIGLGLHGSLPRRVTNSASYHHHPAHQSNAPLAIQKHHPEDHTLFDSIRQVYLLQEKSRRPTKLANQKGERRKEKGERRKEKGERRKEKGERRKEKEKRERRNIRGHPQWSDDSQQSPLVADRSWKKVKKVR